MTFNPTEAFFNQIDIDGNGQIDRSEFRQYFDAGNPASSSFNSSTAAQQYATDAQGYFRDPNPLTVRALAADCPELYTRNVTLQYLRPPPLPPHGPLTIQEVRPPQPPPPQPVYLRRVEPPPLAPPPLVFRQRPPPIPSQNPPRTVTRTVPNPPVPPRSVIRDITLAPPPKPRDISIEIWYPYLPRGQARPIVIPAPPPKPYAVPRNQIIIRECPPPRIEHRIRRLGDLQMDPLTYDQQYGASLLDAAGIAREIRGIGLPTDIVDTIVSTISSINTVTYGQGFSGSSSSANPEGGFSVGEASYFESPSYGNADALVAGPTVNDFDVTGANFNIADTNQDGNLSSSEFA